MLFRTAAETDHPCFPQRRTCGLQPGLSEGLHTRFCARVFWTNRSLLATTSHTNRIKPSTQQKELISQQAELGGSWQAARPPVTPSPSAPHARLRCRKLWLQALWRRAQSKQLLLASSQRSFTTRRGKHASYRTVKIAAFYSQNIGRSFLLQICPDTSYLYSEISPLRAHNLLIYSTEVDNRLTGVFNNSDQSLFSQNKSYCIASLKVSIFSLMQ